MTPFPHYLRRRSRVSRIRAAVLISQNLGMGFIVAHVLMGAFNSGAILAQNLFVIYMRLGQ